MIARLPDRPHSPNRRGKHPQSHLVGYARILQADAYAGFAELYHPGRQPGPVTEAGCWSHGRRKLLDLAQLARASLAAEAVRRIDAIFDAERTINGLPAEPRLALRQAHVAPVVAELESWMRAARARMSCHADVGDDVPALSGKDRVLLTRCELAGSGRGRVDYMLVVMGRA